MAAGAPAGQLGVLVSILLVPTCLHLSPGYSWACSSGGAQSEATWYSSDAPYEESSGCTAWCFLPSPRAAWQHTGGSGSSTMKISWTCPWIPEDQLFPYFHQEDYKILVFIDTAKKNAFHKQRNRWEDTHALERWWVLALEGQSGAQAEEVEPEPCSFSLL